MYTTGPLLALCATACPAPCCKSTRSDPHLRSAPPIYTSNLHLQSETPLRNSGLFKHTCVHLLWTWTCHKLSVHGNTNQDIFRTPALNSQCSLAHLLHVSC